MRRQNNNNYVSREAAAAQSSVGEGKGYWNFIHKHGDRHTHRQTQECRHTHTHIDFSTILQRKQVRETETYLRTSITIRIHGWHQENISAIDQLGHIQNPLVVTQQILSQIDKQLSADSLVAVHIGNILDRWHQQAPLPGVLWDLQRQQTAPFQGTTNVMDTRLFRIRFL